MHLYQRSTMAVAQCQKRVDAPAPVPIDSIASPALCGRRGTGGPLKDVIVLVGDPGDVVQRRAVWGRLRGRQAAC